jgi:hypothetical protein
MRCKSVTSKQGTTYIELQLRALKVVIAK